MQCMIKAMLFFVLITVLFSLQFIHSYKVGVIFCSVIDFSVQLIDSYGDGVLV